MCCLDILLSYTSSAPHHRLVVSARFSGHFLAPGFSRREQGSPSPQGIARFSAASRHASALFLSPPLLKRVEKPGSSRLFSQESLSLSPTG
jgi:hypothetical protein